MIDRRINEVAGHWLPGAQFRETHAMAVEGAAADILDAVEALDDKDDAVVRMMLQLREAPSRLLGKLGGRSGLTGKPRFGLHSFTRLERCDDVVAFGLAGRFWRLDFGLTELPTPQDFSQLNAPGVPRLVMIYAVGQNAEGEQHLLTHTAVHCPNTTSLILFAPYWFAIRLGSGFIRKRILKIVQNKQHAAA